MLCSRSASFTMTTRISFTIASSILRTLSAWRSSREYMCSLLSLVTPSTQRGHLVAKLFPDLIQAELGVLHGIVQQPGFDTNQVHLHVGQDQGDVQRMDM